MLTSQAHYVLQALWFDPTVPADVEATGLTLGALVEDQTERREAADAVLLVELLLPRQDQSLLFLVFDKLLEFPDRDTTQTIIRLNSSGRGLC